MGGIVYEGGKVNNKKEGKGRQTWPDGSYLEGKWADDKLNGYGTLVKGNSRYDGQFSDGKFNGRGKLVIGNVKYEGDFKDDVYHGHGILIIEN